MRNTKRVLRPGLLAMLCLLLLLSFPALSLAQDTAGACQALVDDTFTEAGAACANQDENTACYGFNLVDINYFDDDNVDVTWEPGARTDLTNVLEVATQGADLQDRSWGLSVLNGLANIPRALDSELVTAMLGGVEIYNLVLPDNAFEPLDPGVTVTTVSVAEYREATMTPPSGSDVLGNIPAGQSLVADAISADGSSVRVVFDDRPVWIPVSALDPADALDDLPSFGRESFTPMQNICMGNPRGSGTCGSNTPSLAIVQTPGDYPVDIRVQGTDIRLEGAIVLQMVGNQLELTVVNGVALLYPDTEDEVTVPAGYKVRAQVGDADDVGCAPLVGDWSDPQQLTQGDLRALAIIEDFPPNLLNDPIFLPEIIVPSGVGAVRARIQLNDRDSLRLIPLACQQDEIPDVICDSFAF